MSATAELITLPTLAQRINHEHHQVETGLKSMLEHAYTAGRLLQEAKAGLGHGQWLPWLKQHVAFSERHAQNYMRLAQNWEQLQQGQNPNPQHVADFTELSLRAALKMIPTRRNHQLQIAGLPAGVKPPDEEPAGVHLSQAECPDCSQPILAVTFVADSDEWEPRAACGSCLQTRRAHPNIPVSCSRCGNTGYVGQKRPPGRMLAIDVAWGDEPHARIIGPGTDRRGGEALYQMHRCSERAA